MWSTLQSFFKLTPPAVIIIGAGFPADGSAPCLVPLTTTSDHIYQGPDTYFSRAPNLRAFWKVPRGWEFWHVEQMIFEGQPNEAWDRVYLKWILFTLDDLPENSSIPLIFCQENCLAVGNVFIMKLAPQRI